MSRLRRLRDEIIPQAIENKKFGSNVRLLNVEINKEYSGEDQYSSSVLFIDVFLKNYEQSKQSMVVKYELADESMRQLMWTEQQFYNEVTAYEIVLPFLFETCGRTADDFFPKYYHGVSNYGKNRPEDDIIVIEDLRPKGFRLAEGRLYLDYDHVVVALKKLAEFHSLSYIAKQEKRKEFFEKVSKSKNVYVEAMKGKTEPNMFVFAIERAFKPIIAKNDKKQNEILKRFQRRVENTCQLLQDLCAPSEPSAVFCHGDYCRNNVLFKYDETANKPVDIRFFDLATARYTSPVIDLSFFLFLNTSTEMRQRHWNEFLNIYYGTLRKSVPLHVTMPTFDHLVQEFQDRGVYGFMLCSFFVPIVVNEDPTVNLNVISKMKDEERGKAYNRYGGDKGTQLVTEMAQEMLDRQLIK